MTSTKWNNELITVQYIAVHVRSVKWILQQRLLVTCEGVFIISEVYAIWVGGSK